MQNFKRIDGQERVKNTRVILNENFETVASMFAGDSFPTAGLMLGMKCYRTDLKSTFTLKKLDPVQWDEDASGKLKNAQHISLGGKATSEPVMFDGTEDVVIHVKSVEADSCTGNASTASMALGVRGTTAQQNAPRHVWFSAVGNETQREYADNLVYNPVTGTLAVPKLEGTATNAERATVATRAIADSSGKNIADLYAKKNGEGATGTWNINISGKAAAAAIADRALRADTADKATRADTAARADMADRLSVNVLTFANGTKIWVE